MKIVKIVACVGLGLAAGAAQADASSYSFADFSYYTGEIDDSNVDTDIFDINAAYEINDNLFMAAGYQDASVDPGDSSQSNLSFGIGAHTPIVDNIDVYGVVSFVRTDLEETLGPIQVDADDSGYGIDLGVRGMLSEQFEVFGEYAYLDVFDDSDDSFELGARFYLNQNFALGVKYLSEDNLDGFGVNARITM